MAWKYENDPLNPDAKPKYVSSTLAVWTWFDKVWSCNDWVTWHKSMTKKYGIDYANTRFLKEWNNLGFITSTQDCRSFNTAFRDYTKKVGLHKNLYGAEGILTKPLGSASDVIENVSDGLSGGSKVLKVAIPVVIIVLLVVGLVYVSKMTQKVSK